MKRLLPVFVILLLPTIPSALLAKAQTSKIIIKGADLSAPIEITDTKTLANFQVWTGAGMSCAPLCPAPRTQSFIVDWTRPIADRPSGLHRYEVSFYAKVPDEQLVYVVSYEYDPATMRGYVYFPGMSDEWYRLNVSTIIHGVEGEWFRAWSVWDDVAGPLIAGSEPYVKYPRAEHS